MKRHGARKTARVAGGAMALALGLALPAAGADDGYRYRLSDFSGTVGYSTPHLAVDRHHDEVYVVYANKVRVFNETGMEVYRFLAAPALGQIFDLAVDASGDILTLSQGQDGSTFLTRCDYRGRPLHRIMRTMWPAPYGDLPLHRLFFLADGRLLLVSVAALQVVEATADGRFIRGWDLGALLAIDQSERRDVQIESLSVDAAGNLLLTVPVLFRAFVVSPEGEVRGFGRKGSAPGRFAVISGIAGDGDGNLFVADKLRHVVMIFDNQFRFVREFGYLGRRPENLWGPTELAIGNGGALYVTQRAGRGVSVFSVAAASNGTQR